MDSGSSSPLISFLRTEVGFDALSVVVAFLLTVSDQVCRQPRLSKRPKTLVGQWLVHRKGWGVAGAKPLLGSGWCIENVGSAVAGASKTFVGGVAGASKTRVAVAVRWHCWFSVAGNNPGRLKLTSCFNRLTCVVIPLLTPQEKSQLCVAPDRIGCEGLQISKAL